MVIQTIDKEFEGRTYHAFLVAGDAIRPGTPSVEAFRADDFLRFAEPPAHDRWIPRSGRNQTSQANLTAHYRAPWIPNLRAIETTILDRLSELFGAPPVSEDQPPKSIFKNLSFLQGETGSGARGGAAPRKPEVRINKAVVVDARWHVVFEVRAKNREEGWRIEPRLAFIGLDGSPGCRLGLLRGRRPSTGCRRRHASTEGQATGAHPHYDRSATSIKISSHPGIRISHRCSRRRR